MKFCSQSQARPVGVRRPIVVSISSAIASMAMLSNAQGQLAHATEKHAEPSVRSGAAAIAERRKDLSPGMSDAVQVSQAPSGSSSAENRNRHLRSGDSVTLDTISVSEHGSVDPADQVYRTSGSSAYISGEQIERFRGTSVGDFFSGIPGVLNADSRNSGAVDVNIRGMQGQGRVPVIVDGATQETTVWQGYNGATPRSYIDPDFISSVSIEKGLSSAADAMGATGGVVRATTIGVKDILLPDQRFGIRLKGGFTTNSSSIPAAGTDGGWDSRRSWLPGPDAALPSVHTSFAPDGMNRPPVFKPTGGSGSIALAATTDHLDVVAAYARRHNGNYHAGTRGGDGARLISEANSYGSYQIGNGGLTAYRTGEEILNTSINNTSWLLKAKWKPSTEHALELGYRKYMSDFGSILSSRMRTMPYQSWLSSVTLDTYTAQYRWLPADNDLIDLKANAFLSVIDNRINVLDLLRIDTLGSDNASVIKEFEPAFDWLGAKRRGVTVSNTSRISTGIGPVTLEYGGSMVHESTGLPPGVDPEIYAASYGTSYPREGWRRENSAFASMEWKPVERLTINNSARYSHYKTVDNYHFRDTAYVRREGGWSPMSKITVDLSKATQVYAKYGRAVRAPSIFESLTGSSFYMPIDVNALKLERARNIELGFNVLKNDAFQSGDKLRLHAAYFDNHIDDFLTRASVRREYPIGSGRYRGNLGRLNLDYARMQGFEVSAVYDTGRYFGRAAWNHYTKIMFCARKGALMPEDPVCTSGGHPHSYTLQQIPPKNTVALDVGTRLLDRKLTLGSRLNYVGSAFAVGEGKNIGMAGIKPSTWKPYTLVDVYASYELNRNVSLQLTVDNVADRYYVDALEAASAPAPGRTIRGSVTLKF